MNQNPTMYMQKHKVCTSLNIRLTDIPVNAMYSVLYIILVLNWFLITLFQTYYFLPSFQA